MCFLQREMGILGARKLGKKVPICGGHTERTAVHYFDVY